MTSAIRASLINGRYETVNELGKGAMGVVYRAIDHLDGNHVALKSIHTEPRYLNFGSQQSHPDLQMALANEFQIRASIRHPNIVSVLDYGFNEARRPYFTMELLDSPKTIAQVETRTNDERVELLIQLLQVLKYLHQTRHIIHRDLKPDNVLIVDSQVKVTDFGLAIDHDQYGEIAGAVLYMAPELLRRGDASQQSDLFAAGVIIYEMFAGKRPFNTPSEIMNAEPDMLPIQANSPAMEGIIRKLLAKQPTARYHESMEVLQDIQTAMGMTFASEPVEIRESVLRAARFVGREDHLETFGQRLSDLQNGHGGSLLLGGESGVGKSRLLNEWRTRAMVNGVTVLHGQMITEASTPFALWRNALRQLAMRVELMDAEINYLKPFISDIESLVGRQLPDVPYSEPKGKTVTDTIVSIMLRQTQPTMLILEDLQWLPSLKDTTTNEDLSILQRLTEAAHDHPLLIVGSFRSDEIPDLPAHLPNAALIQLTRFNNVESQTLIESMIGKSSRLADIQRYISQKANGNAQFLVEVIRALAQRVGSFENIDAASLNNLGLPTSIQAIMQSRLEHLADIQNFLEFAAVVGRQINLTILQHSAFHTELDVLLTRCLNANVLRIENNQWLFDHDHLREVLLTQINESRLSELHRSIASAVEDAYPDALETPTEYAASLAYHWANGGVLDKELHYMILAGQFAVDVCAYADAKQFLSRAAELLREKPERKHDLIRVTRQLGLAYDGLSDNVKSKELYQQVLEMAQQAGDRTNMAGALNGLGVIAWRKDDLENMYRYLSEALIIYREIGSQVGESRCLGNLGHYYFDKADYSTCLEMHQAALAISRAIADPTSEGTDLGNLGNAYVRLGQYETAYDLYAQSLALKARTGDKRGQAVTLSNIGAICNELGQRANGLAFLKQSVDISRSIGNKHDEANATLNLAAQLNADGNVSEAFVYFERAAELAEITQELQFKSFALGMSAFTIAGLGRLKEARERFEQALPTNSVIPFEIYVHNQLGLLYSYDGHAEQAFPHHTHALELSQKHELKNDEGYSLLGLANAYMVMKDLPKSIDFAEQAIVVARTSKQAPLLEETKRLLLEAYTHSKQLTHALDMLDSSEDAWAQPMQTHELEARRGVILSLLNRPEEAVTAFDLSVSLAEALLAKTEDLYSPKFSKALALTGKLLALKSDGLHKNRLESMLEAKAANTYEEARENCNARGILDLNLWLLDDLSTSKSTQFMHNLKQILV